MFSMYKVNYSHTTNLLNFMAPIMLLVTYYALYYTICVYLVKNMTWILMELPCRFMSQIDDSLVENPHQIP